VFARLSKEKDLANLKLKKGRMLDKKRYANSAPGLAGEGAFASTPSRVLGVCRSTPLLRQPH
jgi:hypothetical protein